MPKRPRKPGQPEIKVTDEEDITIPVIEEQLSVSKRQKESGRVRVTKSVRQHTETVKIPVTSEHVDVKHVPIDKPVESAPNVRQEGEVTIIPVTEEVVVVTKQLVLKEEIHLVRTEETHDVSQDVTLSSEHVEVTRQDDDESKTE